MLIESSFSYIAATATGQRGEEMGALSNKQSFTLNLTPDSYLLCPCWCDREGRKEKSRNKCYMIVILPHVLCTAEWALTPEVNKAMVWFQNIHPEPNYSTWTSHELSTSCFEERSMESFVCKNNTWPSVTCTHVCSFVSLGDTHKLTTYVAC